MAGSKAQRTQPFTSGKYRRVRCEMTTVNGPNEDTHSKA
jgi:hypothetical protein